MNTEKYAGIVIRRHKTIDAESKSRAATSLHTWDFVTLEPRQWISELQMGHTIQPSAFSPNGDGTFKHKKELWNSTHFVCCDADNIVGVEKLSDGSEKNPEGVQSWTEEGQLSKKYPTLASDAYAVTESVSSMSDKFDVPHRRYRIIFLFDNPITDEKHYHSILGALHEKYPIIPPTERSPAQPVFGNNRKDYNGAWVPGNILKLEDFPMPTPEPMSTMQSPLDIAMSLEDFLRKHGIQYKKSSEVNKFYVECPWKDGHTGGICKPKDAYVFSGYDGKFAFHCSHDTCKRRGNSWEQYRECVAPKPITATPKPTTKPAEMLDRLLKPKPKELIDNTPPEFPSDVWDEGMLDLYNAYLGNGNYFIPEPFIMAAGLTAASVIAGRKYRVKPFDTPDDDKCTYPNLYTLVVGNSRHACKSDSRLLMEQIVYDTYNDFPLDTKFVSGIASKAAMMEMYEQENDGKIEGIKCVYSIDEMANLFTVSRKDWALESQGLLIKLWGNPRQEVHPRAKGDIIAYKPTAFLYGCSTVSWLNETMRSSDVDSGFVNRFFPLYSDGIHTRIRERDRFIAKDDYVSFLQRLERLSALTDEHFTYTFDDNSLQYFDDWADKLFAEQRGNEEQVGSARHEDYAKKISLLFHILKDDNNSVITIDSVYRAIELTDYSRKVASYILRGVVSSHDAMLEQKVIEYIAKQGNSVPKRQIQNALQRIGFKKVGEIIDTLINLQILGVDNGRIFIAE